MTVGPAPPGSLAATPGWEVEVLEADVGELHARPLAAGRTVSVCRPDGPAVVLGSAQRSEAVDGPGAASAGVAVVRRRGGGGAVWLAPDGQLWVDVTIDRNDELWDDDVGRSFLWLGRTWLDALGSLGLSAQIHRRGLVRTDWSDLVCFAGLGPGEVHQGGAKLVGITQRRTRAGARFQCVVYQRFEPGPLLAVLALDPPVRAVVGAELDATTAGLSDLDPPGPPLADLLTAFLTALP